MSKLNRNKFGLTLFGIILLVFAIVLHIFYSLHLDTYHFNSTRFNKHFSAGLSAFREGDGVTAETHFKAALEEAEKESPENKYIDYALLELGETYMFLNKYDEAEAIFQRDVAVAEKVYGPESDDAEWAKSMIKKVQLLKQNKDH
jgi:tetratricopeptide (TPR) repeat protein